MLFQPEHIDLIRNGDKTVTRRDWADNYNQPREGSVHQATTQLFTSDAECDCFIRITDIHDERLGEMTDADARAEGVADLAAFRRVWLEINGEWDPDATVHVVAFEYVGRERPTEPYDRRVEGDRTYWTCPDCGEPLCTWTDCPECGWYDEPAWNRALKQQETVADGGRVTDKYHRLCPNGHVVHIHADECDRCGSEATVGRGPIADGGIDTTAETVVCEHCHARSRSGYQAPTRDCPERRSLAGECQPHEWLAAADIPAVDGLTLEPHPNELASAVNGSHAVSFTEHDREPKVTFFVWGEPADEEWTGHTDADGELAWQSLRVPGSVATTLARRPGRTRYEYHLDGAIVWVSAALGQPKDNEPARDGEVIEPEVRADGGRDLHEHAEQVESYLLERLGDDDSLVIPPNRIGNATGLSAGELAHGIRVLRESDAARVELERWRTEDTGHPWEVTRAQPEVVTDGGVEPTEWVLQKVADLTAPEPDGHQNNASNIYTGIDRMRNEGRKGKVPISKDDAEAAVKELAERGRLFYWHGLIAPASETHLRAIIENERQAEPTRTQLIGKANRLLQQARADAESEEAVADGGHEGYYPPPQETPDHPEPDWEHTCIDCGDEAYNHRCGCCGFPLCGRHHETGGGFCTDHDFVAGISACFLDHEVVLQHQRPDIEDVPTLLADPEHDIWHFPEAHEEVKAYQADPEPEQTLCHRDGEPGPQPEVAEEREPCKFCVEIARNLLEKRSLRRQASWAETLAWRDEDETYGGER